MTTTVDLETAAWQALSTVVDPELDEPITDLGFVASLRVGADELSVELRLPTYFCAPNFAYLMVADAHDALSGLETPGLRVTLLDHFASEEINAGVAAGSGFGSSFQESGELDDLRRTFLHKAHLALQERLARAVLVEGREPEDLVHVTLREAPPGPGLDRMRHRRQQLGLPHGPDAPLLIDDDGHPIEAAHVPIRLRYARATRVSMEGNAGWCRGLLDTRYAASREGRRGLH